MHAYACVRRVYIMSYTRSLCVLYNTVQYCTTPHMHAWFCRQVTSRRVASCSVASHARVSAAVPRAAGQARLRRQRRDAGPSAARFPARGASAAAPGAVVSGSVPVRLAAAVVELWVCRDGTDSHVVCSVNCSQTVIIVLPQAGLIGM